MKYGIALFPSKQLQDIANSYRKRYDPHYALIGPHLTLKEAFISNDSEIQEVINKIHEVSLKIPPIKLHVYKVSSFHPVNNVLYLKAKDDPNLIRLHKELNEGDMPKEEIPYPFVPHITIAQKLSDEEHHDVLESLKMKDVDHEEIVDRFQLLYQLENGSWTVYETFHLGKDC